MYRFSLYSWVVFVVLFFCWLLCRHLISCHHPRLIIGLRTWHIVRSVERFESRVSLSLSVGLGAPHEEVVETMNQIRYLEYIYDLYYVWWYTLYFFVQPQIIKSDLRKTSFKGNAYTVICCFIQVF